MSIRVNAGGPDYTDARGNLWSADNGFTVGTGNLVVNAPIAGTSDPALYSSEHYGQNGVLEWAAQVPNGQYNVTLKFAEIWFNAAGKRVFNIAINGAQVEAGLDIFAAAGGEYTALDRTYPVTVTGGQIDIVCHGLTDNPKFSAIEVEQLAQLPALDPNPPFPDSQTTGPEDVLWLKQQVLALIQIVKTLLLK